MKLAVILGTVALMCGIILIYDARYLAKKLFSFGEQNEATRALKIVGFIISMISGLLIML